MGAALVDLFQHKFPELATGPFYIAGESYAGVYIPTLTKELLTDPIAKAVVPLKGIMVGDPCTDNAAQRDSMDPLWYANKYGLMDSEIYDTLMSDDCDYDHREIMLLKQLRMKNTTTTTTTVTTPTTMSSKSHRSVGKKWSNHVTASELNQELRAIDDLTERRVLAEQLYHDRVLGHNDPTGTETSNTNIRRPRTTRRTNQVDQCTLVTNNRTVTTTVMPLGNYTTYSPPPVPKSTVRPAKMDTITSNPRPYTTTNSADLCATKTTNTICPKTVPRHGLPNLRMKDSSKHVQFQAESITTGYHFFRFNPIINL